MATGHLKREITLFEATIYILGVIVGAGIYVLIGKASGLAGNGIWLSFLLASLIAACTGLSYAELSSTYPYDSAEVLYTRKAFKDNKFAFAIGWLKFASLVIGIAAVALGFGGYLGRLIGTPTILGAIALIIGLTLLNLGGIKQTMYLDIILVLLTIGGLLLVIFAGSKYIGSVDLWDFNFNGVLAGAALIFFAYLGFENIGSISEETKNPRKTLPKALIYSVIISTFLYVIVGIVAVNVVPWQTLMHSAAPLADVMQVLTGSTGAIILSIIALAATASTVLGLFVGGSRLLFGMSEEGSLPKFLTRISKKSSAPITAIFVTAVIAIIFVLPRNLSLVASLSDWGALFVFIIIYLALIFLRFKDPHAIRGFKIPGAIAKVPVIPVVGTIFCGFMMFHLSKKVFVTGIIFTLVGMLLYSVFWEKKHKPLEHHERQEKHIKHYKSRKKHSKH